MPNIFRTTNQVEKLDSFLLIKKLTLDILSKTNRRLLCWNVGSVRNRLKLDKLIQVLDDLNIDISCICETWFDSPHGTFSATIKNAGYNLVHAYWDNKSGGGVAIMYKATLLAKKGDSSSSRFTSFEYCSLLLNRTVSSKVLIVCLYRL